MDDDTTLCGRQGVTYYANFAYNDPSGRPIPLDSWNPRMIISTDVVLLDSDRGDMALVPTGTGVLQLRIGADKMASLPAGTLAYELCLVSTTDATEVIEFATGSFEVDYAVGAITEAPAVDPVISDE